MKEVLFMASVNSNRRRSARQTHEGAPAKKVDARQQLERTLMACMLWEDTFYENGISVAERIFDLVHQVDSQYAGDLAIKAREEGNLRHAPLLVVLALVEKGASNVGNLITRIIQRPDEITEFLAMYWINGKRPLGNQVKKGLANAFHKFDEYQLAKWNKKKEIMLRDVMFLTHPKPQSETEEALFYRLANNELKTPDTWEVNLSEGEDKKTTWERMIKEGKLGGMAVLRNLRNMQEVDVNDELIRKSIESIRSKRILPFRYIAAAKYAPHFEPELEGKMFESLRELPKLKGRTLLLVDISGSMRGTPVSRKSDIDRKDAAIGLAMAVRELTDDVRIFAFHSDVFDVPSRRGFSLRDAINSFGSGGTNIQSAIEYAEKKVHREYDRIIVFTDEQSHEPVSNPRGNGWMINVASYQNGVGYGKWNHIDGFSESVVHYIAKMENNKGLFD
jgi:hypothetical protein